MFQFNDEAPKYNNVSISLKPFIKGKCWEDVTPAVEFKPQFIILEVTHSAK